MRPGPQIQSHGQLTYIQIGKETYKCQDASPGGQRQAVQRHLYSGSSERQEIVSL